MTYILTWSDSSLKPTPITLANNVISSNALSITLTGKGAVNWGFPLQEDLMHMLENFASNGTAPQYATLGQLWYNAATKHLNINTAVGWAELAYRRVDSSSPPSPPSYSGDTWFDTTNHFFNVYDSAGAGSWNRLAFTTQVQGNYSVEQPGSIANAYIVVLNPTIASYANNFTGSFKVSHANTGACTINVGGGAVPLRNPNGGALVNGDLLAGQIVSYVYVLNDNAAYVVSVTQSQTDTRYAKLAGLSTQTFNVATATVGTHAINLTQANSLYAPIIANSNLVPVGTVIDFAGPNAPDTTYLVCPASAGSVSPPQLLQISQYPDLFAALGYTYGGVAGQTFGIPWFPTGFPSIAANAGGGAPVGSSSHGMLMEHHHTYGWRASLAAQSGSSTPCWVGDSTQNTSGYIDAHGRVGTSQVDNMPAGMYMLKCIKAKKV
jgi:microcystin-dependent protein